MQRCGVFSYAWLNEATNVECKKCNEYEVFALSRSHENYMTEPF